MLLMSLLKKAHRKQRQLWLGCCLAWLSHTPSMYADVPWLIWVSFLSLTALHVYANIRAVRALTLTSLNPSRLQLLVDTFYHKGVVLTPREAACLEPLAPPPLQRILDRVSRQPPAIIMGTSLKTLVSLGEVDVAQLCEGAADQLYMLAPCQGCVHVVLATSCTPVDVLMAFVHARVLALMITQDGGSDQVICLTTYLLHCT
ncbi:hypothetical protein ABBQ38_005562 [Trebouxia sp. C0009 RCD-2024]